MGKKNGMKFTIRKQHKTKTAPGAVTASAPEALDAEHDVPLAAAGDGEDIERRVIRLDCFHAILPNKAGFTTGLATAVKYFFFNNMCNVVWDDAAGTITWQVDNDHESIVYEIGIPPPSPMLDGLRATPLWTGRACLLDDVRATSLLPSGVC